MKYFFYALFYLIGSIPFSYLITRVFTGRDIRKLGSGNVGATNVLRTSGKLPALLALSFDFLKGAFCVWLASRFIGTNSSMALAGFLAMLGHSYPAFLQFRGGKSVATGAGAFVFITPIALLFSLITFLIVLAVFRIISLSSIIAAGLFPVFSWWAGAGNALLLWSSLAAALIILRHKSNVRRLMLGMEKKLGEANNG